MGSVSGKLGVVYALKQKMNETTQALSGFPTRGFEFDDLRLSVGHRLQIEIPGAAEPVPARLLGYLKGETLMVKLANVRSTRREHLHEGDEVNVRGFSGRIAFTFKASVEKIRYAPYAYFHLKFPDVVQGTEIRHSERVRVNMPVKVFGIGGDVEQSVEAAIANMRSTCRWPRRFRQFLPWVPALISSIMASGSKASVLPKRSCCRT
jgi:hypothetical protein